jgi:hypothetical protein
VTRGENYSASEMASQLAAAAVKPIQRENDIYSAELTLELKPGLVARREPSHLGSYLALQLEANSKFGNKTACDIIICLKSLPNVKISESQTFNLIDCQIECFNLSSETYWMTRKLLSY